MTLPLWVMSSAGPCGIKEEEVLVETEHSPSRAARREEGTLCARRQSSKLSGRFKSAYAPQWEHCQAR